MSDTLKEVRASALGEPTEFEAAAFRFGHQVRAFLNDFPTGPPVPSSVLPRYSDGHPAQGDIVFGGGSYLHLIMRSGDEVEAWAKHLGVEVTRQAYETGAVSIRTEGTVDGLTVYVGYSGVDRSAGEPQ